VDDSAWKQVPLGVFTLPDHPDARRAVIRKHIEIPAAWNHGEVSLHLGGFHSWGGISLDGSPMPNPPTLAAGSTHVLAVEVKSDDVLLGGRQPAWLSYVPDPVSKQDMNGSWQVSTDFMNWTTFKTIPGSVVPGTRALRTTLVVDPAAEGQTVVFHVTERSGEVKGLVINGNLVAPARDSGEANLNITPWVLPGRKNDIVLLMGGSEEDIYSLSLNFYTPGTYP
jgi:hypothetical protein